MTGAAKRWLGWLAAGVVVLTLGCMSLFVCLPAWFSDGIAVDTCPQGEVRPTLQVWGSGLGRGRAGLVYVSAIGHYTTGDAALDLQATIRRLSADLWLVDERGQETPLTPEEGWDDVGASLQASVRLPQVPDGDYTLRVRAETAAGEASVDVPLGLYAPARIHVLTDRPLYEPGNTVRFRALSLRAADLSPTDGRPGTWTVVDPSGQVLLEERAPAGDWGVVAGSFPLDTAAPSGTWTARWSSGGASGEASFQVEPFTLPRFRVEAKPDKDAYFVGERPVLRGQVVYSSGAPVSGAAMELSWSVQGAWPPPTSWMEAGEPGALPTRAAVDAEGRFELALPVVPADLQGQVSLVAQLAATDPAGDRVGGQARLLLSQDRIQAMAETELGDGLVEGFNNRMYLRVTSAAGAPLATTVLRVQRAWDPTDAGVTAKTDADGVAALQVDPGPAVNVLIPPPPYRPPRPPRAVERDSAQEIVSGMVSLWDAAALDAWEAKIAPCAIWVTENEARLGLVARVRPDGRVDALSHRSGELGACAVRALSGQRLPAGGERLYELSWTVRASRLPEVQVSSLAPYGLPDGLLPAIERGARAARACLSAETPSGDLPALLEWRATPGSRRVSASWTQGPDGALSASELTCVRRAVEGALSGDVLAEPLDEDEPARLGLARLSVSAHGSGRGERAPQPTVMQGYEFRVAALDEEEQVLGETLLRLGPGSVPPVRLRASTVLPEPGDTVTVEILRGPGFQGELPEKLWMTSARFKSVEAKVDQDARTARFTLPEDAEGWFSVSWSGAEARLFVRPRSELALTLSPERSRYAPGESARIDIRTTAGGEPVAAGVGLFGVDESLSQLVPLPGPDALDGLRPTAESDDPAFDVLDGQALTMGRVRGPNAAAAAVMRVSRLPTAPELDAVVSVEGSGAFTPLEPLSDHFYAILAELHAATRAWEEAAKPGELMKPERMAELWEEAVDAVEDAGQPVTDAYGRTLRLGTLPPDLLALTDPRAVVLDATRLPEDVEDWTLWVRREQP